MIRIARTITQFQKVEELKIGSVALEIRDASNIVAPGVKPLIGNRSNEGIM